MWRSLINSVWLQRQCTTVGRVEQYIFIGVSFSKIQLSKLFPHIFRLWCVWQLHGPKQRLFILRRCKPGINYYKQLILIPSICSVLPEPRCRYPYYIFPNVWDTLKRLLRMFQWSVKLPLFCTDKDRGFQLTVKEFCGRLMKN